MIYGANNPMSCMKKALKYSWNFVRRGSLKHREHSTGKIKKIFSLKRSRKKQKSIKSTHKYRFFIAYLVLAIVAHIIYFIFDNDFGAAIFTICFGFPLTLAIYGLILLMPVLMAKEIWNSYFPKIPAINYAVKDFKLKKRKRSRRIKRFCRRKGV